MSGSRVGLLGFGEVGRIWAEDLLANGTTDIVACSRSPKTPPAGCTMVDGPAALCAEAEVILCVVTGDVALDAARSVAPHLTARHLYVDFNSVAPETKAEIAAVVEASGARFVEAAIMAPVPKQRLRAPVLLAGPAAAEATPILTGFGMDVADLGPEPGRAAATKMFRSLIVKGLEALLLECLVGAERYGAGAAVLADMRRGVYSGLDWEHVASFLLSRTALHGPRRAKEMAEVARTLQALGVDPIMARAGHDRLTWAGGFGLKETLGDPAPEDWQAVVAALNDAVDAAEREEEDAAAG